MDWLYQGIISNFIWYVIFIGASSMIAFFQYKGKKWIIAIMYGLGAFSLMVISYHNIVAQNKLESEQTALTTTQNVQNRIRQWVDDFSFPVQNLTNDGVYFHYIVTTFKDKICEYKINVIRPKVHGDILEISAGLQYQGNDSINKLPELERIKLVNDWNIESARLGVNLAKI